MRAELPGTWGIFGIKRNSQQIAGKIFYSVFSEIKDFQLSLSDVGNTPYWYYFVLDINVTK